MREISDREFREAEKADLRRLADRIKGAEVGFSTMARATRLNYKTISRAAHERSVRYDAVVRIGYFLRIMEREKGNGGL